MNTTRNPIVLTVFCLLCSIHTSFTQSRTLLLHTGAALPTGDFADDDGNSAGQASVGLSVGLEYNHPLTENGFSVYGSFDLILNWLQADSRKQFAEENPDFEMGFSKYINAPLSAGLRYDFFSEGDVDFFLKGGGVFNLFKRTNFRTEHTNGQVNLTEYQLSQRFGFKIGAGLTFRDNLQVGLTLIAPGKHEVAATFIDREFTFDQEVSLVLLTVGIPLN